MATGQIVQLQSELGIGYIHETGETVDIFFHATALIEGTFDRLSTGQSVEFDIEASRPRQTRAANVRPMSVRS